MDKNMILEVEHVSKRFARHTALDDVSLSIPRGSVYGLLGPNGAGKTTLIRIINRITAPDQGRVLFDGREIRPEDVYRIGYLPEERGLYKKMKVGEQAVFFARLKGLSRRDAVAGLKKWFVKFGIESWWDRKVDELSKGMAQKVQFIVTVLHEPELLIFDEPFSGFDPINANLLKEEILGLRDKGATVIFSTHNMSSVEEICDHITLINRSRNVLTGRVDEIRRRHGNNIFQVAYRGDRDLLDRALAGECEIMEHPEPELGAAYASLKIHVQDDARVRSVIGRINETVELRSFTELIPSMNDIFIRAVGGQLEEAQPVGNESSNS
ncbi:MAG: ATP-binding cassette domain-containing protein [Alistipes sp.]|nr:ATP-binding cassette domain-containing protein [Alistipes sp.]